MAESLGFATAFHGTSVSPYVSSVPLRVWTPSEALVCDILCGSASLELVHPPSLRVVGVGLVLLAPLSGQLPLLHFCSDLW